VTLDAKDFFERYVEAKVVQSDEHQWDFVDTKNEIELDSYGIRHYREFGWIYGTGVALPRLQQVIEKQ